MGLLITLPQSKLTLSRENIRKAQTTKAGDKELKASIAAQGVLQSLLVTPPKKKNGKYTVHAGARRFRLASELIKESKLEKDYEFPCHVSESEHPEEAALSENMHREGMHPVDEFETFHHLHFKDDMTIPEIAARFGKPKIEIQKRLKLAGVHPTLRDLCRQGKLDIDALEAYSISDDQEQQLQAYESLEGWEKNSPHSIRKTLTNTCYASDHKLVKLIGLQNYTRAGGTTSTDLFNSVKYLHDIDLVEKLAKEKLAQEAEQAKGDWKWVDIDLEFYSKAIPHARTKPETQYSDELASKKETIQEEMKKLEAELEAIEDSEEEDDWEKGHDLEQEIYEKEEALEAIEKEAQHYTSEQMAAAGCILTLDHDGQVIIEKGFVKKEDQKEAKKASPGDDGTGDGITKTPEKAEYSNALETDLQAWRLAAAKTELIYNTDIMAKLALFSLCWEVFKGEYKYETACDFIVKSTFIESSKNDIEESRMHQEFLEYRSSLDLTWVKETAAESWEAFLDVDDKAINKLLAYVACHSLEGSLRPHEDEDPHILDLVLDAVDAKLGKHWRPDRANFFSRINRATAEEEGKIIFNDDEFPHLHKAKPKSEIEVLMEERVSEMDNQECWLPGGF